MNPTTTISKSLNERFGTVETKVSEFYDTTSGKVSEFYDTTSGKLSHGVDTVTDEAKARFEQFEGRIPEFPKKVVAFNRVAAERAVAQVRRNNELVVDAIRPVVQVADNGVRTVVGTARRAAEQTAETATTGVRSVVGQARAQWSRTTGTFEEQAGDLVHEATERIVEAEKSVERVALKSMTKAELYQMAQDLDIEGRADMTKAQLIAAING